MLAEGTAVQGNAFMFAIHNATTEGMRPSAYCCCSRCSVGRSSSPRLRQLMIARKAAEKFFDAYNATRDPLDIKRKGEEFEGAPAYQLYIRGADEVGLPFEK